LEQPVLSFFLNVYDDTSDHMPELSLDISPLSPAFSLQRTALHLVVDAVVNLASETAAGAVELLRTQQLHPKRKSDGSWITDADMLAHRILTERLPGILNLPVISEERVPDFSQRKDWSSFWLIDPIDNTEGLVRGVPAHSSVSIALIVHGAPQISVIAYLTDGRSMRAYGDTVEARSDLQSWSTLPCGNPTNPLRFVAYKPSARLMTEEMRQLFDRLSVQDSQLVEGDRLYQRFTALLNNTADVYLEPRRFPAWDVAPCICGLLAQGASVLSLRTGTALNYNSATMLADPFIIGRRGVDTHALVQQAGMLSTPLSA
jgi:3'(2'), 5'-bisphosphate nucleotidase